MLTYLSKVRYVYINSGIKSKEKYIYGDIFLMKFKEKFKRLRKSIGCTQSQFGKMFGLNQQSVSELESGRKNPSKTLMAYLKYRFSDIFGEDEKIGKALQDAENNNVTKVIIEHKDIIKRFKDPERGLRINQKIIDVQDASDELFDMLDSQVDVIHNTAKKLKKNSKKKSPEPSSTKKQVNGK